MIEAIGLVRDGKIHQVDLTRLTILTPAAWGVVARALAILGGDVLADEDRPSGVKAFIEFSFDTFHRWKNVGGRIYRVLELLPSKEDEGSDTPESEWCHNSDRSKLEWNFNNRVMMVTEEWQGSVQWRSTLKAAAPYFENPDFGSADHGMVDSTIDLTRKWSAPDVREDKALAHALMLWLSQVKTALRLDMARINHLPFCNEGLGIERRVSLAQPPGGLWGGRVSDLLWFNHVEQWLNYLRDPFYSLSQNANFYEVHWLEVWIRMLITPARVWRDCLIGNSIPKGGDANNLDLPLMVHRPEGYLSNQTLVRTVPLLLTVVDSGKQVIMGTECAEWIAALRYYLQLGHNGAVPHNGEVDENGDPPKGETFIPLNGETASGLHAALPYSEEVERRQKYLASLATHSRVVVSRVGEDAPTGAVSLLEEHEETDAERRVSAWGSSIFYMRLKQRTQAGKLSEAGSGVSFIHDEGDEDGAEEPEHSGEGG